MSDPDPLTELGRLYVENARLRALLNGGPCPDCGGRGKIRKWGWHDGKRDADFPCPNPACKDGRIEGVRERLEAMVFDAWVIEPDRRGDHASYAIPRPDLDRLIADLRREATT